MSSGFSKKTRNKKASLLGLSQETRFQFTMKHSESILNTTLTQNQGIETTSDFHSQILIPSRPNKSKALLILSFTLLFSAPWTYANPCQSEQDAVNAAEGQSPRDESQVNAAKRTLSDCTKRISASAGNSGSSLPPPPASSGGRRITASGSTPAPDADGDDEEGDEGLDRGSGRPSLPGGSAGMYDTPGAAGNFNMRSRLNTSGDCAVSDQLGGKYSCGGAGKMIERSMMMNMGTQMMGGMAISAGGQAIQANAMRSGSQQELMKSTGDFQIASGSFNAAVGAINMMMGAQQLKKAYQMSKNAKELEQAGLTPLNSNRGDPTADRSGTNPGSGESVGNINAPQGSAARTIIEKFNLEDRYPADGMTSVNPRSPTRDADIAKRDREERNREVNLKRAIAQVGNTAAAEQRQHISSLAMSGMQTLMMGMQQGSSGAMAITQGAMLKQQAEKFKPYQGYGNQAPITLAGAGNPNSGEATGPGTGGAAITGDGSNPNANSAAAMINPLPSGNPTDLGPAINPNPYPEANPQGPEAGRFNLADAPSGGDGGGGGVSAGGDTAPMESSGPENNSPTLSMNVGGDAYQSSGSFTPGGATGGGGGGGRGGDSGPDLSSLLAKFLPQKDDASQNPTSILDMSNTDVDKDMPYTPLGPKEDLFKRIEETMKNEARLGNIAIRTGK